MNSEIKSKNKLLKSNLSELIPAGYFFNIYQEHPSL